MELYHAGGGPVPIDQIWDSQPVSESTADFFSLGCLLSGEVRITAAVFDSYHHKRVSFKRRSDGEDAVDVVDEAGDEANAPNDVDAQEARWTEYSRSSFAGDCSDFLEPRLNRLCLEEGSFLEGMKIRPIQNHQFEFQAGPARDPRRYVPSDSDSDSAAEAGS